jgi:pimeloyl-ACP methyl ester carboxylesterase
MAEVIVRGARFHYQRLGVGSATVVFLHGLVMDNLSSFYFTLAPPVSRFTDVLLFDLRGHGKTERPSSGYSVPEMVSDLDCLLGSLEITEPLYLVGHSFGGLLAQAFTVAHPDRVRGMVFIDSLSSQAGWGDEMAQTLELKDDERDRRIADSFQSWLGRHSRRKTTRLAETAASLVYGTSLVQDLRNSPCLTDKDLASIHCPVLILCGENSDMRGAALHLSEVLPNADLRVFPGCTHSVLWEATAGVTDLVVEWLRALTKDAKE